MPDPVERYELRLVFASEVELAWSPPSANNAEITRYHGYLDGQMVGSVKECEIRLLHLKPDTSYEFHAVAENAEGKGYETEQKLRFHTLPQSALSLEASPARGCACPRSSSARSSAGCPDPPPSCPSRG